MHSIEIIIYRLFLGQGLSIYIEFLSVAKPYLYMYNVKYYVNIKSSAHVILYAKVGTFSPMSLAKIIPTYYINKI